MKLSVRNFRRVERADIAGGPIVLIGGNNNNGKTSVLQAVTLAVTGWALPIGRAKKDAGRMIRRGQKTGSVTVHLGDAAVRVEYPEAKAVFEGPPMKISTVAAGLHTMGDTPAEAIRTLAPHIGADPVLNDLIDACRDAGMPADIAGKIWGKVTADGWDAALTQANDAGVKQKSMWEQITGQKKWGPLIGASWRPDGWDDGMLTSVVEEHVLIERRNALDDARQDAAVGTAEIERLTAAAAGAEAADAALIQAQAAQAEAAEAVTAAEAARAALPEPPSTRPIMPCPHCGGFLRMEPVSPGVTQLVAAAEDAVDSAVEEKARRDIASADGVVALARQTLGNAKAGVLNAQIEVTRLKNAVADLEQAKSKRGTADVVAMQTALAVDEDVFVKVDRVKKAAVKHAVIVQSLKLQEMLKPSGLRHTVLVRGLDRFNTEKLAPMCLAAGWPALRIMPDMTLMFGDDEWIDLGDAYRWIANALIQIVIAAMDGSPVVVMDGADKLDKINRNKLFGLLMKQPFESLVGMTFNKPDQMPNLPGAKAGVRYWIENGVAEEIA